MLPLHADRAAFAQQMRPLQPAAAAAANDNAKVHTDLVAKRMRLRRSRRKTTTTTEGVVEGTDHPLFLSSFPFPPPSIHPSMSASKKAKTSPTNGGAAESSAAPLAFPGMSESFALKAGLAQMLKRGVIMDVVNVEQAKIAEKAGAVAVMALERVPADIRADGGVARMSDPDMITKIKAAVTIPVMAKARIGHFVEAQILQQLEVDYIDESEVLTMADEENHINKSDFKVPFVCGCRNLGEALRRVAEGAAMLRTKGEAGTGNVVEAVRHARAVQREIRRVKGMDKNELFTYAKEIQAPLSLVQYVHEHGKLPVVNFAAGGVATPADAALMMQLGVDGVFVGSGIFKSGNPEQRAKAIVEAVTHYDDPKVLARVSAGLGEAMVGIQDLKKAQVNFRDREAGTQGGDKPHGTW